MWRSRTFSAGGCPKVCANWNSSQIVGYQENPSVGISVDVGNHATTFQGRNYAVRGNHVHVKILNENLRLVRNFSAMEQWVHLHPPDQGIVKLDSSFFTILWMDAQKWEVDEY
ncbi:hypothetical protein OUZ56_001099 [Daphnia magna]|uniref:Uncharacterized protein n=1 Tax=Daphnia magna TaxID=35525 RepID=A0ABR0A1M8_9CRUS|nr:hypothetical protein OUZ56_001099 [Daphnia magna]